MASLPGITQEIPFLMDEPDSAFTNLTTNGSEVPIPPHKCAHFTFYLYSVSMGIMCILGFVGNLFSYLVLKKDKSSPVASFLLQVIAIADNAFLTLWVLHYSLREFLKFFEIETSIPLLYIRVYTFPILYMAQTWTIWLTVVIALNRFMAVCLPYRAPHLCTIYNVYKEVAVVTLFSIVYNVPRFFALHITVIQTENETDVQWGYTEFGKNEIYGTVYVDALYYLFTFVLPLLILAFVNTKVTLAYHASQKRRRRMTSRRNDNENNITLVMIIVVLIFMLCQAPARIVQLIWNYQFNHCEYQYYIIHITNTLEVLNSSINFFIYFMFRKRFRDIIFEHFCLNICPRMVKESNKATTTEGLSLVQIEKSNCGTTNHQTVFVEQNHNNSEKDLTEDIEKLHSETIEQDVNDNKNHEALIKSDST